MQSQCSKKCVMYIRTCSYFHVDYLIYLLRSNVYTCTYMQCNYVRMYIFNVCLGVVVPCHVVHVYYVILFIFRRAPKDSVLSNM